jgi:hypothetical protein
MDIKRPLIKKPLAFLLLVAAVSLLWLPRALGPNSSAAVPHKVHIAFGFHVNLYHSFRGDTNDENGFGQDIRVIRHTIGELDRYNQAGVPVSAVWDFDNLFSLEQLLPGHAPDIIQAVQRRVRENRDDVILMSYNNGLASAMDHEEFTASIAQAISNDKGSGVRDLFGRVTPVVRPQEMMTTPGNFKRYRELGIDYVSLYYSATPFDAFRVFARELTPGEAHNPITYENPRSGEEIVVIPTYHPGDLVEHVSLRHWAEELHQLQSEGKIDRDVLLFINFDADADFWTGADLPWHLDWLPNTGGIGQLVDSVADLDFVEFTKLSDYLAHHPPAGRVQFGQDTADGSFNGYHSWAEKAAASDYWTRILRNRRACETARRVAAMAAAAAAAGGSPPKPDPLLDAAFALRLRALATTNFGLASPFLARQREQAMADLLTRLDEVSDRLDRYAADLAQRLIDRTAVPSVPPPGAQLLEAFVHLNPSHPGVGGGDLLLDLSLPSEAVENGPYLILDVQGHRIPATLTQKKAATKGPRTAVTLKVAADQAMPDGIYHLYQTGGEEPEMVPDKGGAYADADAGILKNKTISVHFNARGLVESVTRDGMPLLEAGSLIPYLIHQGKRLSPERLQLTVVADGKEGAAVVRLYGPWEGPPGSTRAHGWVDYRLRLEPGLPYLFVEGALRYPDTLRRQLIQADKPMLARKIDAGWEAVAPLELRFAPRAHRRAPFTIHKRNFLGEEGAYAVDYFRHAARNLNVASVNNHITAAYAAVSTAHSGMAVAMNPAVKANFAFCPFQMVHAPETGSLAIRANPFGTYDGRQILPPTRGNRQGYEAVLLSAPQLQSAAPTYNGHHERFEVMIAFFDAAAEAPRPVTSVGAVNSSGVSIPPALKADLMAYAERPLTLGTLRRHPPSPAAPADLSPGGFLALPHEGGVVFHWETGGRTDTTYRLRCRAAAGTEEKLFTTDGTSLFVQREALERSEGFYSATVEALDPGSGAIHRTPEIRFRFSAPVASTYEIPLDFKAKVFWANLSVWIRRYLL